MRWWIKAFQIRSAILKEYGLDVEQGSTGRAEASDTIDMLQDTKIQDNEGSHIQWGSESE